MPLVPWFTATMHLPPKFPMETWGNTFRKLTYSNSKWTMNEDFKFLMKNDRFSRQLTRHVSWFFVIPLGFPWIPLRFPWIPLGFPWMGVTVKLQPRIVKYPKDMKMAYMQQEADLDNTKTAFEDETNRTNGGKLAVSLDGGTPISHPKMIIFSRKTQSCWVPPF